MNASPFISLNSWNQPGAILQAWEPEEVVEGGPEDWAKLREALARRRKTGRDSVHPQSAAVGYITYEGAFRFAWFPKIALLAENGFSGMWNERRASCSGRQGYLLPGSPKATGSDDFISNQTRAEFEARVAQAQDYISAGDIYQVNLSHPFAARWDGDAFAFYEALRHYSPAPQAAFMELGGRVVLSASPESFLKISGRSIRTRPIKGTRPRRTEPNADALSAYELRTSPKETAELVMITDLERNDLGRICEYGSVCVRELLRIERFEQVYHLVSTVEGHLRSDVGHVQALRACFPGGSITGAPKKRAREIIAGLEPWPRGLYTGAIGWFGFNGESHFNIAIRTVVAENGVAHFHVGAGIVADSVPEKEWQETLDKAAGILLAAERFGAP